MQQIPGINPQSPGVIAVSAGPQQAHQLDNRFFNDAGAAHFQFIDSEGLADREKASLAFFHARESWFADLSTARDKSPEEKASVIGAYLQDSRTKARFQQLPNVSKVGSGDEALITIILKSCN